MRSTTSAASCKPASGAGGRDSVSRSQPPFTKLRNSVAEFSCYPTYDYVIVNDKVDEAVHELRAIIAAEKCRIRRLKKRS